MREVNMRGFTEHHASVLDPVQSVFRIPLILLWSLTFRCPPNEDFMVQIVAKTG